MVSSCNNKKIRLLIPIRNFVGGIRTYLNYTHGNLDKDKYELFFLLDSEEWRSLIVDSFEGFKVNVLTVKKRNSSVSMFLAMFSFLMRNRDCIVHSQGLTAGMISIFANILFRRPHVITLHQVFGKGYSIDSFFEKHAGPKKFILQSALARADKLQCVGDDARENLLEFFPRLRKYADKVVVIRNGINIGTFESPPGKGLALFEKEDDKFYIGFLGRYMPHKGFQYVIDVVDTIVNELNIKDIKVMCVGGPSGFISRYQNEITKRTLGEYFEFMGFVENVAPILKELDLLLMPSLAEACSLLAMESMVCGTPIVAFSCIGIRELLENTPARMVPVGDRKRLVEEILKIKTSYKSVKLEFDNFMPQARERYDVKSTSAKLDELFGKLAEGHTFDTRFTGSSASTDGM